MLVFDHRSFVVVFGVVLGACGDSAADDEGGSTGADSTQGDDVADDDGSPTSTPDGSSSDGGTEESDDGVDTTAGESSTGTPGCTVHDECRDPLAPACVDGTCSPCDADASACGEIDAALPACGPDGACVECTAEETSACTGNTPVCDLSTLSCIRCTAHAECPDSACDIETGACLATDCVVDVDADGDGDYLDIESALAGETDDTCVLRVHTPDDESAYNTSVQIDARTIALLGVDPTPPEIQNGDTLLQVSGGAVVYVSEATLIGGSIVDDATLHVVSSDMADASFAPVRMTSALSRVRLSNTWVSNRAGFEPAIVVDAGELECTYTTIVGAAVALSCDDAASASLRNSFVISEFESDALDCPMLEAQYTAFENEVDGRGNVAVGPFDNAWFDPIAIFPDRLSVDAPAELATTARWTPGDPTVDIDGDPRPDRDGAMDFAGADVVP